MSIQPSPTSTGATEEGPARGRYGVDGGPPERGDLDEAGSAGQVDGLAAPERRRVEDDHRLGHIPGVDGGGEGVERRRGHGCGPPLDVGQLGFGLLGHPPDRRSGKDVVELVGEQEPPGALQFARRRGGGPGGGRPQLRRLQRRLALAVSPLDAGLAGERPPVLLEVEVTDPYRQRRRIGFDGGEEGRRRLEGQNRGTVEVTDPPGRLEHLPGRPAAAVAVTEGVDGAGLPGAAGTPPASTCRRCRCRPAGSGPSTRVPSMPSHQNVWWGNRLVSFQDSFWETNQPIPAAAMIWGRAAL